MKSESSSNRIEELTSATEERLNGRDQQPVREDLKVALNLLRKGEDKGDSKAKSLEPCQGVPIDPLLEGFFGDVPV